MSPTRASVLCSLALTVLLAGCAGQVGTVATAPIGGTVVNFTLASQDFEPEGPIPRQFTCDGANTPPELHWAGAPESTKSYALLMEDPDAPSGIWIHWVVYNIPRSEQELAGPLPQEAISGTSSYGKSAYGGPCPPGGMHRYFFRLYALDAKLDLAGGADKSQLMMAMQGHVLGEAELMGTYTRQR